MSRRTFSQALEKFKVSVVTPLYERAGDAGRKAVSPIARLRASGFFTRAQRDEAKPESAKADLQSDFQKEFYKNFDGTPTTTEANGQSFRDFERADYAGYYATPDAVPLEETVADATPERKQPLLTRLRGAVSYAALTARNATYAAAQSARAYVIAKIRDPRQTAFDIGLGARAGGLELWRRLRGMRRMDAAVAGLFTLALLGPIAAPRLTDNATIALTRHNPLVDRLGVTAERGLALSTPSTPTVWNGVPFAIGERDIAPEWVLNAGVELGPLSPAEALSRPAQVVEITPSPVWSPALAALGVEDDTGDYLAIETASIAPTPVVKPLNRREVANLELGAFDTGPTAPSALAEAPAAIGDDRLAAGDYATASAGARAPETPWPTIGLDSDGKALPSSVVQALSLGDSSAQELPLKSARIPSMRPVMVGAKRTPRLTVVLTAVGLNESASRAAIERLPSAVALAVAPVAKDPSAWVDAAHATGRTALLEIPMEPVTYPRVDPGPLTLLAGQDAETNLARLRQALNKAPDVDGVASYLGSRFTSVRSAVAPVMAELKKEGLFLIETDPGPLSQLLRTAAEIDMPALSSIVSLDKAGRAKDLSEGIARLEEAARVKGHAIGVAVAVPSSVEALAAWARDLEKRGFRLAALPL